MHPYLLEFRGGPWDGGFTKSARAPDVVYLEMANPKDIPGIGPCFQVGAVFLDDWAGDKARYTIDRSHACLDTGHKVYQHAPRPKGMTGAGLGLTGGVL